MKEIKIHVDDGLLEYVDYQFIESRVQDFVSAMLVKFSAMEVLNDLDKTEISSNEDWQKARNEAWEQEKEKYLKALVWS